MSSNDFQRYPAPRFALKVCSIGCRRQWARAELKNLHIIQIVQSYGFLQMAEGHGQKARVPGSANVEKTWRLSVLVAIWNSGLEPCSQQAPVHLAVCGLVAGAICVRLLGPGIHVLR